MDSLKSSGWTGPQPPSGPTPFSLYRQRLRLENRQGLKMRCSSSCSSISQRGCKSRLIQLTSVKSLQNVTDVRKKPKDGWDTNMLQHW